MKEKRSALEGFDGAALTTGTPADILTQAEKRAAEQNKKRSIREKITRKNRVSGVDILSEEAAQDNAVFDQEKKVEKERQEQYRRGIFRHNILTRVMYLVMQSDAWSFLSRRDLYDIETTLGPSIRGTIDRLEKSGNVLEKAREDYDDVFGDGEYEKRADKELYQIVHDLIIEEEKKVVLLDELRKRHPENSLFKTGQPQVPDSAENKRAYAKVFCATHESSLDHISQEGLRFAGEEMMGTSVTEDGRAVNTNKMALEKIFQEVAPEGHNRRSSVFAVPEYRDSKRSGAMQRMGEVVLEIMVDADSAMVFDVEKYNSVAEGMWLNQDSLSDSSFREQALQAARDYWSSGIPLSKYLRMSLAEQEELFITPEILIPEIVLPEQINVVSLNSDSLVTRQVL